MRHLLPVALVPLLLAGCVAVPAPQEAAPAQAHDPAGVTSARLTRADASAGASTWAGVRYDRARGSCTDGAEQLVDAASFERIAAAVREQAACAGPGAALAAVPETTAYPTALIEAGIAGSAHVLTIVDASGVATDAFAVCVSDRRFAAVAEAAALGLRYEPAACDGNPRRSAVLVPLAYDPD